ncbi:hypothetical protein LCGC14_1112400 [marine sediment metagenome]|uniref:Uncharacterized protein n=1 Tax=marine sediment metagenome TaxID=412755 RepID=A0A0F9PPI0_9ZZZZ
MTPQDALTNLDGVVAQVKLDRASTLCLIDSTATLQRLIDSIIKPSKPEAPGVASSSNPV